MNELDTALTDIDGLQEAFHALCDKQRKGAIVRDDAVAKKVRRQLAAGADTYAATVMSSSRGELDMKRVRKARSAALDVMPAARKHQKRLSALVEERRLSAPEHRADLTRLLTLSLHCRTALSTLAPTVDRRAADALGNKVLVELRGATLLYLSAAREAADGNSGTPRAAVVEHLKRIEAHAIEVANLAPPADVTGAESSMGASLSRDVVAALHQTAVDWHSPEFDFDVSKVAQ
ncbi:MAG: hypothetical protein ABI633_00460 [Burkholderiales bacterium]